MKNKNIKKIFGGEDADAQNVLRHIFAEREGGYIDIAPKTTMAIRLLEDLHSLGYNIVKEAER